MRKHINVWWPCFMSVMAVLLAMTALGTKRITATQPLDLSSDGTEIVPVLRNKKGELLLYNFRAVEAGKLYRSSGFPRNVKVVEKGETKKRPAAYADGQLFEWLRARKIRTIVTMQEIDYFYAEEGYFDWWAKRTGYQIEVVPMTVKNSHAYETTSAGGVRAAAKFLNFMKKRQASDGAVLIHCDAGKDRTGVAVAAYELQRNAGRTNSEILWQQVRRRYLASNASIEKDTEVAQWAGDAQACGKGEPNGFVCGSWLDKVRKELEVITQL